MAQLDRVLAAMTEYKAEALVLEQDRAPAFRFQSGTKPVSRQVLDTERILGLIAELTGRPDTRFEAVAADDLGRAAPRPPYTVLAVDKYENATDCQVPTWRDALKRYLESTNRLR